MRIVIDYPNMPMGVPKEYNVKSVKNIGEILEREYADEMADDYIDYLDDTISSAFISGVKYSGADIVRGLGEEEWENGLKDWIYDGVANEIWRSLNEDGNGEFFLFSIRVRKVELQPPTHNEENSIKDERDTDMKDRNKMKACMKMNMNVNKEDIEDIMMIDMRNLRARGVMPPGQTELEGLEIERAWKM